MTSKTLRQAVAYLRTSSAANVGADKDSERRQGEAVEAFALSTGYEIIESYYDSAVSGPDAVTARPGFLRCSNGSPRWQTRANMQEK
ncbi:recombinase family protein [Mesorhizobium caraganae]|uniref:recombinase family protein n=1 Tax=Mesorhizobium caraganae TaxID=483206 RepID=UPI003ED0CA0E